LVEAAYAQECRICLPSDAVLFFCVEDDRISSLVARLILLLLLLFVGIFLLRVIMRSCLFFEFIRSLWLQVGTQVPPAVDEKIRVWIYCCPEFASLLCVFFTLCVVVPL
jgi:hypothetical protein